MTNMIVKPANKEEYVFLMNLFQKMHVHFKPLVENKVEDDSSDWDKFSLMNLSQAYSDYEPEYTSDMILT